MVGKELSSEEKATLVTLAHTCNFSLAAHQPEEHVCSRFPKHLRGDARKNLKSLGRKRFCSKHPNAWVHDVAIDR
jgi:hypothetical protein